MVVASLVAHRSRDDGTGHTARRFGIWRRWPPVRADGRDSRRPHQEKKLGLDVKADMEDSEEVADCMKEIEASDDAWANWSLGVVVDDEGDRSLTMHRAASSKVAQAATKHSSPGAAVEFVVEEQYQPATDEAMGFLQCCYDRCDGEIRSCRSTMKGIRQVTPQSSPATSKYVFFGLSRVSFYIF